MSGGHGTHEHGGENKRVALIISILALFLAVAEILGQKAQTTTLQENIKASNLWAFFQAKTIRRTVMEVAADEVEVTSRQTQDAATQKALLDQVSKWRATAKRYRSEPETGEGSEELMKKAREAEELRDKYGKKHYRFELATGAFQIAIVLASATIITGIGAMLWAAGGLGGLGVIFLLTGIMG